MGKEGRSFNKLFVLAEFCRVCMEQNIRVSKKYRGEGAEVLWDSYPFWFL